MDRNRLVARFKWIRFCLRSIPLFFARQNGRIQSRSVAVGAHSVSLGRPRSFQSSSGHSIGSNMSNQPGVCLVCFPISETRRENVNTLIRAITTHTSEIGQLEIVSPDRDGGLTFQGCSPRFLVILHDVLELRTTPWWSRFSRDLLNFRASLKEARVVVLVQDDYTASSLLDNFFCEIRPDLVATGASQSAAILFPRYLAAGGCIEAALTGYAPEPRIGHLWDHVPRHSQRAWDIGTRVRQLNPIFGELGERKARQAAELCQAADRLGLSTNISTDPGDVFLGGSWMKFLRNCRAIPSTLGGASLIDRQGLATTLAVHYEATHGSFELGQLGRLLRRTVTHHNVPGFSPRVFEAANEGCLLLLDIESETLGMEPFVHFVPLTGNWNEDLKCVERVLSTPRQSETLSENAYDYLINQGRFSYNAFVRSILTY
jgi:hypothetical protein